MPNEVTLETRLLQPGDKLTGLRSGDAEFAPLKTFLQKRARIYHERHLARTYVTMAGGQVAGYITLVCGEIVIEDDANRLEEPDLDYNYKSYPALKIARLLVDGRFRGNGIGEDLVKLALGIAKDIICPNAGCRFAVVDAKQRSVGFYERQGFTMLDTSENRARSEPVMFIDLHKSAAAA